MLLDIADPEFDAAEAYRDFCKHRSRIFYYSEVASWYIVNRSISTKRIIINFGDDQSFFREVDLILRIWVKAGLIKNTGVYQFTKNRRLT